MKKYDYIIGIDPDIEKTGLSVLSLSTKRIDLYSLPFPKLLEFLKDSQVILPGLCVYVEAGWLISHNWHTNPRDSKALAASKGNAVGRNHETGRKIVEMARHYGLEVYEARPLKKCWRGPDGKITHEELAYFVPNLPKRTNQEQRDAALISWHFSGFPIRVKPITSKQLLKPQH